MTLPVLKVGLEEEGSYWVEPVTSWKYRRVDLTGLEFAMVFVSVEVELSPQALSPKALSPKALSPEALSPQALSS